MLSVGTVPPNVLLVVVVNDSPLFSAHRDDFRGLEEVPCMRLELGSRGTLFYLLEVLDFVISIQVGVILLKLAHLFAETKFFQTFYSTLGACLFYRCVLPDLHFFLQYNI